MTGAYHRDLAIEAHADAAELRELREQLHALHGTIAHAEKDVFDGLRQQLDALHGEFKALHEQDKAGIVDKAAHRAWRARLRSLRARAVALGQQA